jgi:hypothetical protein
VPDPASQYRYWAFISYSSRDAGIARRLHRRLEQYHVPRDLVGRPGRDAAIPRRVFPIFRDRDELPLSSDLGSSIGDALRASRYLIVLCSPHSARSRWVNEEIRQFKALGREDRILAVIVDGEPNASDSAESADVECFAPALRFAIDPDGTQTTRRVEPIGGDLRKGGDGWTAVVMKAVAGMTGVGLDALARRQKKRERRRQIAWSVAAAAVVLMALAAWDYNRLKIEHYANVGLRWGVPEGIGALPDSVWRSRDNHYVFESRRNKVRRVLSVNSSGRLTSGYDISGLIPFDAPVLVLSYREDGAVQDISLRNRHDRLVGRYAFSQRVDGPSGASQFLEFRDRYQDAPLALPARVGLSNTESEAISNRSEITAVQIVYDATGRLARLSYVNQFRQPRGNTNGIFGARYQYDGSSLLWSEQRYLSAEGALVANAAGVAVMKQSFTDRGEVIERTHYDANDAAAFHPDFGHRFIVTQDAAGNTLETRQFDVDGRPTLGRPGFHLWRNSRDARGYGTGYSYFGTSDEPVIGENGCHRVREEVDDNGWLSKAECFDTTGRPTLFRPTSAFRHAFVRDEYGDLVSSAVFDVNGKPTIDQEGVHHRRLTNQNGLTTALSVFGSSGEPVLDADGCHTTTSAYNDRGQQITISCFGSDGTPAYSPNFGHRQTRRYDVRGNLVELTMFGTDGARMLHRNGLSRQTWLYDDQGNLIEVAAWGLDDKAVSVRGSHKYTQTFDAKGNPVERAYFDSLGRPALVNGVHRFARRFNEAGLIIEQRAFGTDGKAVKFSEDGVYAVFGVKRRYDSQGRMVEESYYDGAEAPDVDQFGSHAHRMSYDARGNVVELRKFGRDGAATTDTLGIHRMTKRYDQRNQAIEESYFGVNGEPAGPGGVHIYRYRVDNDGHRIEETAFGTGGAPTADQYGVHRISRKFNDYGDELEFAYFGVGGQRVAPAWEGFHLKTTSYDERNRIKEQSTFGADGNPAADNDGYVRYLYRYDSGGGSRIGYRADGRSQ